MPVLTIGRVPTTELAESQASDSTVMAIAGHVSPKMLAHYSHVRLQAKRTALDSLSTQQAETVNARSKSEGYDTNHDTKNKLVLMVRSCQGRGSDP